MSMQTAPQRNVRLEFTRFTLPRYVMPCLDRYFCNGVSSSDDPSRKLMAEIVSVADAKGKGKTRLMNGFAVFKGGQSK